jgi:hypothetical protein
MPKKYGTKSCTFIDNGLFVEQAIKFAAEFHHVNYYSPWRCQFPKSEQILIGDGLGVINRVNRVFEVVDDTDLFMFPDSYQADFQVHLENLGKRVWGSRYGEDLEQSRDGAKELFTSLGLPVGPYETMVGMEALREYLKKNKNVWVKINMTRGDTETFWSKDYDFIEPKLAEMEHELGPKKHIMKFIVEEALDDKVEIGYDGYCVDGQFPNKSLAGIEVKDLGYVGYVRDYDDLPEQLTTFNKKISPYMKKNRYRNYLSTEIRIGKDGVGYMNDFCGRSGSPPSELYQNMLTNACDIAWEGAEGKIVHPVYSNKCGVEVLIDSPWAEKHYLPIQIPKKIRDNVKIRNLTVIDGVTYFVPQAVPCTEAGAVVADGATLEEAFEKVKDYCDQVEGIYIKFPKESIAKADEEFAKLKEFGITV